MRKFILATVVWLASGLLIAAQAAVLPATPATLAQVQAAAKGGDTVVLGAATYAVAPRLRAASYSPPLVIDATGATITAPWTWADVDGVTFKGGAWAGLRLDRVKRLRIQGVAVACPTTDAVGVKVVGGQGLAIVASTFTDCKTGIALSKVDDFEITDNGFSRMRSDGAQFGEVHRGLIARNAIQGTLPLGVEHPDCIQLWSRPTSPPTSDIRIVWNRCVGDRTQGIGLFNHVRDGVDDGGFDRIAIEDNDVFGGRPQGVAAQDVRGLTLLRNTLRTWPGSANQVKFDLSGSIDVTRGGNRAEAAAGKPAVID